MLSLRLHMLALRRQVLAIGSQVCAFNAQVARSGLRFAISRPGDGVPAWASPIADEECAHATWGKCPRLRTLVGHLDTARSTHHSPDRSMRCSVTSAMLLATAAALGCGGDSAASRPRAGEVASQPAPSAATDDSLSSPTVTAANELVSQRWTFDLDSMAKRRAIRVLVPS